MARKFLSLLLASIILIDCAAAPSATPTNVATQTPPITSYTTNSPTISSQQNITKHQFAYIKSPSEPLQIIITDADGTNRKTITLPQNSIVRDLKSAISPDGKWLAFHTGTAGVCSSLKPPFNLTLNIMSLNSEQILRITPLLSDDYPNNFSKIADLGNPLANELKGYAPTEVCYAFMGNSTSKDLIYSLAWSPDSKLLAFAGAMDGLSSEVYLYDLQTRSIKRLSNDTLQVQFIQWSPNGNWLIYARRNYDYIYTIPYSYAISVKNNEVKDAQVGTRGIVKWVSSSKFITYQVGHPVLGDLYSVDLETSQVISIWKESFWAIAFDPEKQLALISPVTLREQSITPGLYLLNTATQSAKFIAEDSWNIAVWGTKKYRFLASNTQRGTWGITADGSPHQINSNWTQWAISPYNNLLALYLSDEKGLYLYNNDGDIQRVISSDLIIEQVFWRPDSQALFFTSNTSLYYLTVPNGKPILIDDSVPKDYYGFTWVFSK